MSQRPDPEAAGTEDSTPLHELPERLRQNLTGDALEAALVMTRLARLSRIAQTFITDQLHSVSMSYSDYYALHQLAMSDDDGHMTPTQLNESLGLSSGGITKAIDRLEAAGFVRRSPDPNDGRGVVVSLTVRGRRRARMVFSRGVDIYVELLSNVEPAERGRIAGALENLLEVLDVDEE